MNTTETGCGGGGTCGSAVRQAGAAEADAIAPAMTVPAPTINGIALHADGAYHDSEALQVLPAACSHA